MIFTLWRGGLGLRLSASVCCEEEGLTLRNSRVRMRRRVGFAFLRDCISFHSFATKYVRQMLTGDVTVVGMVAVDCSAL